MNPTGGNNGLITAALLQELGNGSLEAEVKSLAAELRRRGVPYRLFVAKRLERRQLELNPATLVAGHIPVVNSALRQLGVEPPAPNDYPQSLRPWLHRRVWEGTVKNVVAKLRGEVGAGAPFFAKPLGTRRFTGHVFESWEDLGALSGAPDRLPVICSEVVRWKTEHRVFVVRGRTAGGATTAATRASPLTCNRSRKRWRDSKPRARRPPATGSISVFSMTDVRRWSR